MSTRAQATGAGRAKDGCHERTATAPDHTGLLRPVSDLLRVSLGVTTIGIAYLHESPWVRAFLALGLLYAVTSSFTLAKCVRDRQEETAVVSRVDQARLDKLLAEQDLLRLEDH